MGSTGIQTQVLGMAWKVIREVGGNGSTVTIDAKQPAKKGWKTNKLEFQDVLLLKVLG